MKLWADLLFTNECFISFHHTTSQLQGFMSWCYCLCSVSHPSHPYHEPFFLLCLAAGSTRQSMPQAADSATASSLRLSNTLLSLHKQAPKILKYAKRKLKPSHQMSFPYEIFVWSDGSIKAIIILSSGRAPLRAAFCFSSDVSCYVTQLKREGSKRSKRLFWEHGHEQDKNQTRMITRNRQIYNIIIQLEIEYCINPVFLGHLNSASSSPNKTLFFIISMHHHLDRWNVHNFPSIQSSVRSVL